MFCDEVQKQAVGAEVIKTLKPADVMVKIVHDELVRLMGPVDPKIPFVTPGPTVLLMAGLQGSGKTTTCGKMAKMLLNGPSDPCWSRPTSSDRPPSTSSKSSANRSAYPSTPNAGHQNPVKVCRNGIAQARKTDRDVVILDTAGRLAIDEELMAEVAQVAQTTNPQQIYLVLDAMTGQDAVNTARAFNERLELDGVILTKFDSDTRGGAALSVKQVTGKPIKFIGVGEKLEAIEPFHPDRIAGRILGMGDMLSLVEQAQKQYDAEEAAKLEAKMKTGKFGLDDFLLQLRKMKQMGSMRDLIKKIPGMGDMMGDMEIDEGELARMEAVIQSMTPRGARTQRSSTPRAGAASPADPAADPSDVSQLVKSFEPMRNMMKAMSRAEVAYGAPCSMGTQFSKMMAEGGVPKMKGSTACPIGCLFCESGQIIRSRSLTVDEILCQFDEMVHRHDSADTPQVLCSFQGIGEPSLVPYHVIDVGHQILMRDSRFAISVSTTGANLDAFRIWRESGLFFACIQISLGAPTDNSRESLMDVCAPIEAIIREALWCAQTPNTANVKFNLVLIAGVNDSNDDVNKIISLFRDTPFTIKLSSLNKTTCAAAHGLRPSSKQRALSISRILRNAGINSYVFGAFSDIDMSCGQLVALEINGGD
jgi:signal recognition particle subunit SRP54